MPAVTLRYAVSGAIAVLLCAAASEPLHAQRKAAQAIAPASSAGLPRDLRQVRLLSRPAESGRRGHQPRLPRNDFGRRHGFGLFAPVILVGVHVGAPHEATEPPRRTTPDSKVIDVAETLRSAVTQSAGTRAAIPGDSTNSTGAHARIESLAWLEGCWEASSPQRTVEERWTAPRAGNMLGSSRTTRSDSLLEHEFITLRELDGVLAYQAQPSGQPAAEFRSTRITDSSVVFENPKHGFPRQIGYRLGPADSLHAWIEGPGRNGPRRVNFEYRRVACSR